MDITSANWAAPQPWHTARPAKPKAKARNLFFCWAPKPQRKAMGKKAHR